MTAASAPALLDVDVPELYAAVWRANQDDADELRELARQARARLVELERERMDLEAALPRLEAAARALNHPGRRPSVVEPRDTTPQRVDLRVLSSLHPTPHELADRELAHTTEGAA